MASLNAISSKFWIAKAEEKNNIKTSIIIFS